MKQLLALFLALALVFCLCGCHGSEDIARFEVPDEFDTSRNYEITFWAKNDTNVRQVAVYEKAVKDFEALYPNIKVKLQLYTDYGRIYKDVITNISTGTTPNVCITYPDHIATYLTGGDNTVVPLDQLFADRRYGLGGSELRYDGPTAREMVPEFLDECIVSGRYYAIPYMRSTEACYVNQTFVEKLGYEVPDVLTWDFIWEVSEAATAKHKNGNYLVNGQKTMIPFLYKSTDNMMIQYLRQQEAGYSTGTGQVQIFNDTTEEFLYTIAGHTKTGAFSTFKISSYPANFLNAGQCIFAVDSTAGATWMGSDAPLLDIPADQLVKFETAVRPVPQVDPENPVMISQGPSMCIFNKEDPQEVLAAWLFAQFMLTDEVQMGYAKTEGYLPVTTKTLESDAFQTYLNTENSDSEEHYPVKLQATRLLLDNVDNTFVTPVFNGSTELRNAAGSMIEEVAKATRRKKTVDDAFMDKLYQDMTARYKLDQLAGETGKAKLEPLPAGSVILLCALGGIWVLIGAYGVSQWRKSKKMRNTH